jgi:menaquinone-dependent protoporphyrinogen oxidase
MPKALVTFATEDGQTSKIALRIAELLRANGAEVTVRDSAKPGAGSQLAAYDGVVIGSAIHLGHHAKALLEMVKEHRSILRTRHTALFCVSLSAGGPNRDLALARQYLEEFSGQSGWKPDQAASFAGAIRHSRYGILRTLMVHLSLRKSGAPQTGDHEYTDWKAVEAFAESFAKRLSTPKR